MWNWDSAEVYGWYLKQQRAATLFHWSLLWSNVHKTDVLPVSEEVQVGLLCSPYCHCCSLLVFISWLRDERLSTAAGVSCISPVMWVLSRALTTHLLASEHVRDRSLPFPPYFNLKGTYVVAQCSFFCFVFFFFLSVLVFGSWWFSLPGDLTLMYGVREQISESSALFMLTSVSVRKTSFGKTQTYEWYVCLFLLWRANLYTYEYINIHIF